MTEDELHTIYTYLQSERTARSFLKKCYQQRNEEDAERKSYENARSFIYYLKHGKFFYEKGENLPIALQPILYFYGMINLIKAILLTVRPNYPETTKVLAHGVSSRKLKRKNYSFLEDEVKIQKNGLFPYLSKHLFQIEQYSFEKITMEKLFALLPEMHHLFQYTGQPKLISVGHIAREKFTFPIKVLDHYHLTEQAFLRKVKPFFQSIHEVIVEKEQIVIRSSAPLLEIHPPFTMHERNKQIFFPLDRDLFIPLPKLAIHYLLLYNLSMVSRYETEWWGDLIACQTEIDFPFIRHFLSETVKGVPILIGKFLYQFMEKGDL